MQLDQFKQPVQVTVHYSDAKAQGLDESTFRIGYYDGTQWVFYPSQVDPRAHKVGAQVGHFSLHAILGSATPWALDGLESGVLRSERGRDVLSKTSP